jgi:hypothetical protein
MGFFRTLARHEALTQGLRLIKLSEHTPFICQSMSVTKTQPAQIMRFLADDEGQGGIQTAQKSHVKVKVSQILLARSKHRSVAKQQRGQRGPSG